jgi:hypothetical protein
VPGFLNHPDRIVECETRPPFEDPQQPRQGSNSNNEAKSLNLGGLVRDLLPGIAAKTLVTISGRTAFPRIG